MTGVATRRVRKNLARELRQRGVHVRLELRRELTEVDRARPRVAEAGRRRGGGGVGRCLLGRRGVQTGHGQHRGGNSCRHGERGYGSLHRLAVVAEAVDVATERLLRRGDRAADRDVAVLRLNAGDLQAGGPQPGRHLVDAGLGRAELGLVLRHGQELPVRRYLVSRRLRLAAARRARRWGRDRPGRSRRPSRRHVPGAGRGRARPVSCSERRAVPAGPGRLVN